QILFKDENAGQPIAILPEIAGNGGAPALHHRIAKACRIERADQLFRGARPFADLHTRAGNGSTRRAETVAEGRFFERFSSPGGYGAIPLIARKFRMPLPAQRA